jgi:hypothetical protein
VPSDERLQRGLRRLRPRHRPDHRLGGGERLLSRALPRDVVQVGGERRRRARVGGGGGDDRGVHDMAVGASQPERRPECGSARAQRAEQRGERGPVGLERQIGQRRSERGPIPKQRLRRVVDRNHDTILVQRDSRLGLARVSSGALGRHSRGRHDGAMITT